MSIKTFVVAATVAAGTFGLSDRADAQWRYRYSYPTYNYSYPSYSYSYPTYTYPSYYNSSGVVTSGYTPLTNSSGVITTTTMPYGNSYYGSYYNPYGTYMDPYNAGLNNAYYSGYSNLGGNPYGISAGTRGGMIFGRRAWRW
jgi:hypothetical protein